jgi:cytoskeletal protein CcmA (bactofilin family)/predicted RNA-binding Zn-ribbon protein involved in translation (DUF1610 family)
VAAKGRVEIRCPHCGNTQFEPELAQSTNCRKCGGYIQLKKGRKSTGPDEGRWYPLPAQKVEGSKGRVEVQCPHCGNLQLEPESAKSTYCRKCSGYIQLEKSRRPAAEQVLHQKPGFILQKWQGLFGVQRTLIARCFECGGEREVPKNATSTLCPKCGAYIELQDYKIEGIYSRSIRTGGRLIVTKKGTLNCRRAFCGSADIQGTVRGDLICSGAVTINLKGKLSGSIEAKTVHIEKQCEAEMVYPMLAESVEVDGIISGRIMATRKVIVNKTGRLTGSVSAHGFIVEKGGFFIGELSIGKTEDAQRGKLG